MIKGVGHKIALLTLQYALNKIELSLFTSLKYFVLLLTWVIFQGIPVDIHVQNWVKFLSMIDYSNAKQPEYVCWLLEGKIPKD